MKYSFWSEALGCYPRLLSRSVRASCMAARATALAASLRAWTLYHRFSRGLRRISLSGCGLKKRSGLMYRSKYAVAVRTRRRTGSSDYQPGPAPGLIPARHEGSDGRWRVDGGDRGVVAAGAPRSKGRAREFTAWFRGRDAVRDFDEGLVEIAEEPMRMAELRHTQEPIGEQFPAA
jgi:hypothetical protein